MPAFRPYHVVIHPEVEERYSALEARAREGRKHEAALWKSFQTAVSRLKNDGQWGEVIPRIPPYFVQRYGIRNLYCVDLAFFHRAFYTIEGRSVIILDLVDHSEYDRLMAARR